LKNGRGRVLGKRSSREKEAYQRDRGLPKQGNPSLLLEGKKNYHNLGDKKGAYLVGNRGGGPAREVDQDGKEVASQFCRERKINSSRGKSALWGEARIMVVEKGKARLGGTGERRKRKGTVFCLSGRNLDLEFLASSQEEKTSRSKDDGRRM